MRGTSVSEGENLVRVLMDERRGDVARAIQHQQRAPIAVLVPPEVLLWLASRGLLLQSILFWNLSDRPW